MRKYRHYGDDDYDPYYDDTTGDEIVYQAVIDSNEYTDALRLSDHLDKLTGVKDFWRQLHLDESERSEEANEFFSLFEDDKELEEELRKEFKKRKIKLWPHEDHYLDFDKWIMSSQMSIREIIFEFTEETFIELLIEEFDYAQLDPY